MLQVRVDENLKKQASDVYEAMGIDLSTAVRMFLIKSIEVKGIPFKLAEIEPEDVVTTSIPQAAKEPKAPKAVKAAAPKAPKATKAVAAKPAKKAAAKTSEPEEPVYPKPATFRNMDMSWD